MQKLWQDWLDLWRTYPLLRWTLLHALAWNFGILLAALGIQLLGFWGFVLAGAIFGLSLGIAQAWLLYEDSLSRRRWMLYSALGGLAATFPAYALSFVALFSSWVAALLIGLAFGIGIGGLQTYLLAQEGEEAVWQWLGMTLVAAVLATWLMLFLLGVGIPIWLSPSGILYGVILQTYNFLTPERIKN